MNRGNAICIYTVFASLLSLLSNLKDQYIWHLKKKFTSFFLLLFTSLVQLWAVFVVVYFFPIILLLQVAIQVLDVIHLFSNVAPSDATITNSEYSRDLSNRMNHLSLQSTVAFAFMSSILAFGLRVTSYELLALSSNYI